MSKAVSNVIFSGSDIAGPSKVLEFLDELVFQNDINAAKGNRSLAGMLIGQPGIGKTQVPEDFPMYKLAQHNSEVISKEFSLKDFKLKYSRLKHEFDETKFFNSIHYQTVTQLLNEGFLEDDERFKTLDQLFKEKKILWEPYVGVVV